MWKDISEGNRAQYDPALYPFILPDILKHKYVYWEILFVISQIYTMFSSSML